mmetsp:Transcript_34242/g.75468  ORF Transcript_34242/g.75468 Transcript_34242/m.75468 type:complete len:244 (+) Transcript_34242:1184-1915(+)
MLPGHQASREFRDAAGARVGLRHGRERAPLPAAGDTRQPVGNSRRSHGSTISTAPVPQGRRDGRPAFWGGASSPLTRAAVRVPWGGRGGSSLLRRSVHQDAAAAVSILQQRRAPRHQRFSCRRRPALRARRAQKRHPPACIWCQIYPTHGEALLLRNVHAALPLSAGRHNSHLRLAHRGAPRDLFAAPAAPIPGLPATRAGQDGSLQGGAGHSPRRAAPHGPVRRLPICVPGVGHGRQRGGGQ